MHLNGLIVCLHKMQQCIYLEKKILDEQRKNQHFRLLFFFVIVGVTYCRCRLDLVTTQERLGVDRKIYRKKR